MKVLVGQEFGIEALVPTFLTFPGGEEHCTLPLSFPEVDVCVVDARPMNSASQFLRLIALTDALRGKGVDDIHLFLPYVPGARQDRAEKGVSFDAHLYAKLLNKQNYASVWGLDVHSPVIAALVDGFREIPMEPLYPKISYLTGIICPDAGAERRALRAARHYNLPIVYGRKHRDAQTGALSAFSIDNNNLSPGDWLVVDDICDGGGTFVGLAKEVKVKGVRLHLFTSHGIFSKGLEELKVYFKSIHTTDSFPQEVEGVKKVRSLHESLWNVAEGVL